jgi:hypothetical protein
MSVLDILNEQFDVSTVQQISRQIGADADTTEAAIVGALPVLLGGLARNAQQPSGAAAILGALGKDHDGGILDDLGGFLRSGSAAQQGAGILGHIFGGSQQQVQGGLSRASGLDPQSMGKLLAILAPIVMAALARVQRGGDLDSAGLAGVLGGDSQRADSMLGGIATAVLDQNRDGQVMDDVLRMGGDLLGGLLGGKR